MNIFPKLGFFIKKKKKKKRKEKIEGGRNHQTIHNISKREI
jgi:hypothetical protein